MSKPKFTPGPWSTNRCDLCGRFQRLSQLVSMQAEGNEIWFECKDCMSPSDLEIYFPSEVNNEQTK